MAHLHVLTNGTHHGLRNGCTCPSCKGDLASIVAWRSHCQACGGDERVCREGKGPEGDFAGLVGCRAFTDEGKVRPKRARKPPLQPWDVKPAKAA
jgi:hypothetical protein